MADLGTRSKQTISQLHQSSETVNGGFSRDVGMSKRVVASLTFTAATSRVTGANGTFTAFSIGDPIVVRGTALNNGEREVTGIDGANQAYLVLDFPPKDEGPITAEVRAS